MTNSQAFIEGFNPVRDELIPFLSACRDQFDENYGKWHQTDYLETDEPHIEVDIITGGWSDNEAVVEAMLRNTMINQLFYELWERGGRHVFKFKDLKK